MTIINGGLINCGAVASSSSNSLALSDGLACFTGSFSGVTTTSISHNLNSSNLVVEFKDQTGNLLIPDTWSITNANVIEAEFSPAATGDVTIIACIESGLAPITGGVTTIEGLSGIVDLDSPNNSIVITTSGQVINLNAIFTPASGAVLEQKCRDIEILSGLIGTGGGGGVASINNVSGIVTLTSTNNGLEIGVNGQAIEFTPLFTYTSGQIIDQHSQDLLTLSGLIGTGDAGQTSINGLSGVVQLTSPDNTILIGSAGQAIELSGLFTQASGAVLEQKCDDLVTLSGTVDGVNERLISLSGLTDGLPRTQTSVEGVSGVVDLEALDGTIVITVDGQTIQLSGLFNPGSGQIIDDKCLLLNQVSGITDGLLRSGTTVNGLSGLVSISGVNLEVTTSGQTILVSGIMNAASGAILEQKCRDIDTLSGLILADTGQTSINGLSGAVSITSPDGSILIGDGPQAIELSGLFTSTSGALLQQKCADIDILSGLVTNHMDSGQTSINGLSGLVSISGVNLEVTTSGQTVLISGIMNAASGAILEQKCDDIITLSGLILPNPGQTSINGISGVTTIDSPNDTISVVVNGQVIELDAIFTWTSGQLLESLANASGVESLNGVSGVVDLTSPDGTVLINPNGQTIELTVLPDAGQTSINTLSGVIDLVGGDGITVATADPIITINALFTSASGAVLQQKCEDVATLSGITDGLPRTQTTVEGLSGTIDLDSSDGSINIAVTGQTINLTTNGSSGLCSVHNFTTGNGTSFTVAHNLQTEDFVWSLWRTDDSPNTTVLANVAPSGMNSALITLDSPMNGKLVIQGCASSGFVVGDVVTTRAITSSDSPYGASTSDSAIFVNASGGMVRVNLPEAEDGKSFYIKRMDNTGNDIEVSGIGPRLIDNSSSLFISSQYDAVRLTAHDNNWWII